MDLQNEVRTRMRVDDIPGHVKLRTAVRKAFFPVRWTLSVFWGAVSRAARGISLVTWCIHVGIDYYRLVYLDYTPEPDDIFVVSYPRSGTTWLQMILYQLTTDGSMDFVHIAEVCPWFERVALNKRDITRLPRPRVFKSHLPRLWIPKGTCRYIYVARDGRDVAVSMYHFYKSHFRYKGDFRRFFKLFMRGWVAWGSWFSHVAGWWKHRDDWNVLFLRYEDMVRNLESCVRKIIDFCGLEVPEERIPEILKRCSFQFMKEHEEKFDYALELMLERGCMPRSFIRKGRPGGWRELFPPEELERFNRQYEKRVKQLGLSFDAPGT